MFRWQNTETKDKMDVFELLAGATNLPSSLGITRRIRQRSSFLYFFYKIEKRPLPATLKEEGAVLMSEDCSCMRRRRLPWYLMAYMAFAKEN